MHHQPHARHKRPTTVSERGTYERIEDAIVRGLCDEGPLGHTELVGRVASRVGRAYRADVGNLVLVVTLDLEARGVVERAPGRAGLVQLRAAMHGVGGMTQPGPVVLSLPIADRRTSGDFYRTLLGTEPFGDPADDGVPEPLQFAVNDGLTLMLVPTDGFVGLVIGDGHEAAPPGSSECVVSLAAASEDDVAAFVGRARDAGAAVVTEPVDKGWGHHALVADPDDHLWMMMVTP